MPTINAVKLNYLLAPLAFLYGVGVRLRNWLFNRGLLSSEQYPIPVISIGNLSVGGTGKTPHTEYLIHLLSSQYKLAVLSRGYKRKTSGFVLATANSLSDEIGDEPYQIKQKYPHITVAVDANRRRAIRLLLNLPEEERPQIILMDDAFQHRYVTPSFSIVLTDFHRLFYYDRLLPMGRLREPAHGILRADVVVVTKCETDMKPIEQRIIEEDMQLMAHQRLFFTHICYGELVPLFPSETIPAKKRADIGREEEILLLAGIAAPAPFIHEVRQYAERVTVLTFPDHHGFGKRDFKSIQENFDRMQSPGKLIIVTEKDAARLKDSPLLPKEWKQRLYYLPITIDFCAKNGNDFDEMIKKHIFTVLRNHILR